MDFSESGTSTPLSSGSTTPRHPERVYQRPAGLDTPDLESANEKLARIQHQNNIHYIRRHEVASPLSNRSTTHLNPATEMSQIPEMPMLKAAGLAGTLMVAAFLNVCRPSPRVVGWLVGWMDAERERRLSRSRPWSSPCPLSARHSTCRRAGSSGSSRRTRSPSAVSSCCGARSVISTGSGSCS